MYEETTNCRYLTTNCHTRDRIAGALHTGSPVIAARWVDNGKMRIVSGPEKLHVGSSKRERKVFAVRTYDIYTGIADGFAWFASEEEAVATLTEP